MYLRRTDDVGSTPGPPDGYGSAERVSWGALSGTCLTWGGTYSFSGTGAGVLVFGLVDARATRFVVVMADGSSTYGGRTGSVATPGFRVWFTSLPDAPVDHIEARDADNDLVAAIANPQPGTASAAPC